MKLREALQTMAPSLALQRAAADEIARLDALVEKLQRDLTDTALERDALDATNTRLVIELDEISRR